MVRTLSLMLVVLLLPSWPCSGEEVKKEVLRSHECSLFFYVDPFLYKQTLIMHGGNATAALLHSESLIYGLVDAANDVYASAEFYGRGRSIHRGIKFYLADYVIDETNCGEIERDPFLRRTDCHEPNLPMVDLCRYDNLNCTREDSKDDSFFCNDILNMRFYLHAFSAKRKHSQHCLSYALTYRSMLDFQGIAWVKGYDKKDGNTLHHFGYCSKADETCNVTANKDGYWRNTGVINVRVLPDVFSIDLAADIFVHELGHSLGARHDDQCEEKDSVRRKRKAKKKKMKKKKFLMTSKIKHILTGNTSHELSTCSMIDIGRNLDLVNCWQERKGSGKKYYRQRPSSSSFPFGELDLPSSTAAANESTRAFNDPCAAVLEHGASSEEWELCRRRKEAETTLYHIICICVTMCCLLLVVLAIIALYDRVLPCLSIRGSSAASGIAASISQVIVAQEMQQQRPGAKFKSLGRLV